MEKGTHGVDEKAFEELTYTEQAKSLNASILYLEKAINAHLRKAQAEDKNGLESKKKYISQLKKLIENLE